MQWRRSTRCTPGTRRRARNSTVLGVGIPGYPILIQYFCPSPSIPPQLSYSVQRLSKNATLLVVLSYQTIYEAVTKQFNSGEGAIQFAPEAIARSNADILNKDELRKEFIEIY